ncbi:hypothetical protein VNO77_16359 [Canavalia gladiata]|uniref:CRIB domain-containing protein n=1 Tax=Canavalia gladiata TaxID=3824 RepID=A0AAN9M5D5_CANGL
MSGNKVKGFLKGFRYISQIFENDKDQDIQIGYPTDVKHVAHIGWDGPSVNSPSWMNEFKSSPGFASPPVNGGQENGVKWAEGVKRDLPELPKASRRGVTTDSPTREKSEKTRQPRKSSNKSSQLKDSSDGSNSTQQFMSTDPFSPARTPPDIPRKSRRKKSKENSTGSSSSKLRSKVQSSDPNVDSMPKSKDKQCSFEENETL